MCRVLACRVRCRQRMHCGLAAERGEVGAGEAPAVRRHLSQVHALRQRHATRVQRQDGGAILHAVLAHVVTFLDHDILCLVKHEVSLILDNIDSLIVSELFIGTSTKHISTKNVFALWHRAAARDCATLAPAQA